MGMSNWSTNPCENVSLGGYNLSLSDRAPLAQLMADVKEGVEEGVSSAASAAMAYIPDALRQQTEKLTGGRNTVIYDSGGNPHLMVVVPRFCIEDAVAGSGGSTTHPAFIVDGKTVPEVLIGKFAVSYPSAGALPATLPGRMPACSVSLESALLEARRLGPGFAVATNAEYAARRLLVQREHGSEHCPTGNTEYGRCAVHPWETGVLSVSSSYPGASALGTAGITLTGTGPHAWTDDGTPDGMADAAGNLREWAPGVALGSKGRIFVMSNNDAHMADWLPSLRPDVGYNRQYGAIACYINAGGSYVSASAGALIYACTEPTVSGSGGAISIGTASASGYAAVQFSTISGSGVSIPPLLVALGLAPASFGAPGQVAASMGGTTIRYATRGQSYKSSDGGGLWSLRLTYNYSTGFDDVGFRISYIPALGNA